MTQFVELRLKRNRGWPWPEDSWGLTPMFGEGSWCRSCGVPQREQRGSLILQRMGLAQPTGAWVPNWQFDAICLERSLGDEATARFDLEVREVEWHGSPPGEAVQIVVPSVSERWFDPDELRKTAVDQHGAAGAACSDCGTWRRMPMAFDVLPRLQVHPGLGDIDVAASPEWFGDGWLAFRQVLLRRELAELIASHSPGDFRVHEVH